jgi:DNA-binding CsgD family transcriptional regulator
MVPATDRLLRAFATRSLALPEPVRSALLIAAVDDGGELADVLAAASAHSGTAVTARDLTPAVTTGLIRIDSGRISFRHALVRAAVHDEADGEQHRQAHLALAGVLTGQPERRAWHRAAASPTADAELAGELEQIAVAARRRGGMSTALAAQQHAIALSVDGPDRLRRLLDGAALAFQLGDRQLLEKMVAEAAGADGLGPAEQARLEYLNEAFDFRPWTAETISAAVDRARAASGAGYPAAALDLLGSVIARSYMQGADEEVLRRVTEALDELDLPPEQPGALRLYAYAAPVERGATLLKSLHAALAAATGDAAALYDVAMGAGPVGDYHLQIAAMTPAIEELRRRGQVSITVPALWALASAQYLTGDWAAGEMAAAESARLALDTGQRQWAAAARLTAVIFTAVRGDGDEAGDLLDETLTAAPLFAPSQVARATGMVALAGDRYDEAYLAFARVFTPGDPAYHSAIRVWLAVDLAEAAAAAGRRGEAKALLQGLNDRLSRTPSPLLHASMAAADALLAPDHLADELFTVAGRPQAAHWPFIWGRTQLAFGAWLRRQRRVNESRTRLRAARDQFDRLGAAPWGERARRELRAAGERSPVAAPSPAGNLTAQELQIATLAAQGLTNREIGERLFLSHRTVGTYLYQTFPKLGVSSRQQLASALARAGPGAAEIGVARGSVRSGPVR